MHQQLKKSSWQRAVALCGAVALAPMAMSAHAMEDASIDGYYVPYSQLKLEAPSGYSATYDEDDNGDGFGAKMFVPLGPQKRFIVTGEYESTSFDDFDSNVDEWRLGGGMQFPLDQNDVLSVAVLGEYVNFSIDDVDMDGYGVHARLGAKASPRLSFYVQGGYVDVSGDNLEFDGPEYLVGAAFQLMPNLGVFADYRYTDLEEDSGVKLTYDSVRTGIRYSFGG